MILYNTNLLPLTFDFVSLSMHSTFRPSGAKNSFIHPPLGLLGLLGLNKRYDTECFPSIFDTSMIILQKKMR